MAPRLRPSGPHVSSDHVVRFYADGDRLTDAVSDHARDGCEAGEAAVIVGTGTLRDGVAERLESSGIDVEAAVAAGDVVLLDAREMLSEVLRASTPDEARFRRTTGEVLDRVAGAEGRPVRFYSSMADLLCADGRRDEAVHLEALWNDFAVERPLSLLCGYSIDRFASPAHAEPFRRICRSHGRVVPAESFAEAEAKGEGTREIARLQQRAAALERETRKRRRLEGMVRELLDERRDVERSAETILRCRRLLADEARDALTTSGRQDLETIETAATEILETLGRD